MRLVIILTVLLMFIGGCAAVQSPPTIHTVLGTTELLLTEQDLQQLGMTNNGTDCLTEEYPTDAYSPLAQYSFCNYIINSLNTEVVLELKKFTNFNDLNGSYQYDSSHLYSVQGLMSENDFGDQSRFRVSNEHDYGSQFNDPNVFYYHLWISKNEYLIHITSKGSKEAKEYIAKMGQLILSKFQ